MNSTRTAPCELLGRDLELPARPARIVSLVSGFTEALYSLGLGDLVVGVSKYCSRYVQVGSRPVVGDYLRIDESLLASLEPDLVLLTGGVQLGLARRLAKAGFPVHVLGLPDSIHGILENIRRIGALMGEMESALGLTDSMEETAARLRSSAPDERPRVYAELWFGTHPRMAGGLGFTNDIVELAGGRNIFRAEPIGYLPLHLESVAQARPDRIIVFSEEDDHPVDAARLLEERGWTGAWPFTLVESGIARGRNLIHDGPSILETASWLAQRI
jgi:ABC-type Fe3+-hydroxamate transport system substrate-binding protein